MNNKTPNMLINIPIENCTVSNEAYRISFGEPPQRLISSIQKIGVLQPLWAKKRTGDNYQIVLGYKRFHAARIAGVSSLPCLITDDSLSDANLLMANIYDNLSSRELAPLETALALKISDSILGRERTLSEIMPTLGMKSSVLLLERMIQILSLPKEILNMIHQNTLTPTNAFVLLSLESPEQQALCRVFESLKPGTNLQRELSENIIECSRRDGVSIWEIIQRSPLSDILSDNKAPTHIRAEKFRAALRWLRYPRLSESEMRFQQFIEALKLPSEIRVTPPLFFEGADYHADIRFKSSDELLFRLDRMVKVFSSPEVQKMFGSI